MKTESLMKWFAGKEKTPRSRKSTAPSRKHRPLRLETLETRALLAVTTGFDEGALGIEPTGARTYVVDTTEDVIDPQDGKLSLREALASALARDVITFDGNLSGETIYLSGTELTITREVVIDASNLDDMLTIHGNQSSAVFHVATTSTVIPVEMLNLIVTGGDTETNGGGIFIESGALMMTECILTDNTSYGYADEDVPISDEYGYGGGIYNLGKLTMDNCVVTGNSSMFGGGIYNLGTLRMIDSSISGNVTTGWLGTGGGIHDKGSMTLTRCYVTMNSSASGGGFYCDVDNAILTNCVIRSNSAENGGAFCVSSATVTLTDCEVSNNADIGGGGAFQNFFGTITINRSVLRDNVNNSDPEDQWGGGVICNILGTVTLTNCLLAGNQTNSHGGAIYNMGTVTLVNSTVAGNSAGATGGGIINDYSSPVTIYNSIVARNTAGVSGDDITFGEEEYNPGPINGYYSLSSFEEWSKSESVLVDDGVSPLFNDPDAGDWSLSPFSSVIDMGNNDYISDELFDLAGNERIIHYVVDLGAYEIEQAPHTTHVTTLEDVVNPCDELTSLREAIANAGTEGLGTTITFDPALAGGTITLSGKQLAINKPLLIDASGLTGGITIDAGGASRVLHVSNGTDVNPVTLIGLTLSGGYSRGWCGGIYNQAGTLEMISCRVTGNSADYSGGIYNSSGTLILTDCSITGNSATYYGGGIYNSSNARLTMTDSLIADNRANYAGGLHNQGNGQVTFYNVTVAGNSANYIAGIRNYGTLTLYNSIVARNTAKNSTNDIGKESGSIVAYNALSGFVGWDESEVTLVDDATLPLFSDPVTGDYTLAVGSQAIDMGNDDFVSTAVDLAGNPRIVGSAVDLGAYEYQGGGDLPVPGNLKIASAGANRHAISWDAVSVADGYEWSYSRNESDWTILSAVETSTILTGLTYGDQIFYRVRSTFEEFASDWSATVSLYVCPMDINGDKIISGADVTLLSKAWFSRPTSANWDPRADVDASGMVNGSDMTFLSVNWLKRVTSADLLYPAEKGLASDVLFSAPALSVDFAPATDLFPADIETTLDALLTPSDPSVV